MKGKGRRKERRGGRKEAGRERTQRRNIVDQQS